MTHIVVLRTYMNETEARFAATVLKANGIPSQVMADNAGGALPSIALLFPIRLLVRGEDESLARSLLDTSIDDDGPSSDGEDGWDAAVPDADGAGT